VVGTESASQLQFYDLATRTALRDVTLPPAMSMM
jgi:hypothetical protein